ncbi:uncharacterized protein LOC127882181 [Dreissena polymorpha]|uniref:THAP-type domain-containing protein n=1 Tax=Dreissena polymorpha TaxID=45954 RepID=A0A9D4JRS7_DREPO|nr:uncharacterized protein LOC127882181 [Dreissena polymorpha]KAH3817672.1 hypothetical protein DPMN_119227 [Dreissena polymorpha]
MALTCAVINCSNSAYWLNKWKKQLCTQCGCLHKEKDCKCDPPFRLFCFPTKIKNSERRERWKQLIGRKNGSKLWTPGKDSRVCSNHFVEGQPTVQNPLPTLNLGYDGYESRVKRILFLQEKPVQVGYRVLSIQSEEELFVATPYYPDPEEECLKQSSFMSSFPVVLLMVIQCMLIMGSAMADKIQKLTAENAKLRQELRNLRNKKYVDNVLKTDDDVNFYTGFKSLTVFEKLHNIIAPLVNRRWLGVKAYKSKVRNFKKEQARFGPLRKLSSRAEFLLMLMRLRLGLLGRDLANRFQISECLCGRIFHAWLKASAKVFSTTVFMPDEETLIGSKPRKFQHIQDLNCIIDCTEIFIETPKDVEMQCITWSDYKHHTTLKVLVACAPNSAITYVSPVYTGRISNKALTLDCGFLDRLPPYSMIMADKGFNILEECSSRSISLYVPPGRCGQSQMTSAAVRKNQKHCKFPYSY